MNSGEQQLVSVSVRKGRDIDAARRVKWYVIAESACGGDVTMSDHSTHDEAMVAALEMGLPVVR